MYIHVYVLFGTKWWGGIMFLVFAEILTVTWLKRGAL